jgi:hypothetical protein
LCSSSARRARYRPADQEEGYKVYVYQAQTPPVQSVEATDRRNAIVSDADLREAARQLTGTITGTVANSEVDRQQ